MAKVALETIGCRLNQYETERLAEALIGLGLERVSYRQKADIYVLNTCTVTGRADADCRKLLNRARRLNRDAVIAVTGCYTVSRPDEIEELGAVDLVVDNDRKMRLPELLRQVYPQLFDGEGSASSVTPQSAQAHVEPRADDFRGNRALVKIGDGCNQCCSYCIVPRVRGPLVSFSPKAILDEIRRLIAEGFHEIVLTAVHIGRYEYDGLNLGGLVERILNETNLSRLRLSSMEPNELTYKLLEMVAHNPRVCRHLHLPLQSGSDPVLKEMRRPYRRDDYLSLVEKIKTTNSDITVGCDLIVGFPGETDDDFKASLEILDSGLIDYGHIFSYSDRPGTVAANLSDKVNPSVIKERNRRARDVCGRHRRRRMRSQVGKFLEVVSERTPNRRDGYNAVSDNYLKVHLPKSAGGGRRILRFRANMVRGDHIFGDVVWP